MDERSSPQGAPLSRRTLARGAAWSVPVVAVGSAAPALAASPQPGLQGWVQATKNCNNTTTMNVTFDSYEGVSPQPTPIPPPAWGLYVYNITDTTRVGDAFITVYVPSSLAINQFTALTGNVGWSTPTQGAGTPSCTAHICEGAPPPAGYTAFTTRYVANSWYAQTGTNPPRLQAAGRLRLRAYAPRGQGLCETGGLNIYITRSVCVDGQQICFTRSVNL